MTPSEILSELRDIELPESELAGPAGWSSLPFLILALVLALLAFSWWRRSTLWRRQARAELGRARALPDPGRRWEALLGLLARVARHRRAPPPPVVFLPPDRIGAAEEETLARHIDGLLHRSAA